MKRRGASTFTGGRKPNYKPSINFFGPKTGTYPSNKPFSAPYTNKYFKLKQTPTRSAVPNTSGDVRRVMAPRSHNFNSLSEVPPRFVSKQVNNNAFVSNVQKQVNIVVTHNNNNTKTNMNNTTRKVLLPNGREDQSSVVRSNMSKQGEFLIHFAS